MYDERRYFVRKNVFSEKARRRRCSHAHGIFENILYDNMFFQPYTHATKTNANFDKCKKRKYKKLGRKTDANVLRIVFFYCIFTHNSIEIFQTRPPCRRGINPPSLES